MEKSPFNPSIMKNMHLFPTDLPSRLYEFGGQFHLHETPQENFISYNIYVSTNEPVQTGDWGYLYDADVVTKYTGTPVGHTYKVVFSNDSKLIEDGVQALPEEFLQWFIKNQSIDRVKVTQENICARCHSNDTDDCWSAKECSDGKYDKIRYKIVLAPREETNCSHPANAREWYKDGCFKCYECSKIIVEESHQKEQAPVTLEEAANNYSNNIERSGDGLVHQCFIAGVKFQETIHTSILNTIESRLSIILSEPPGITRETMLHNLLIGLI